MMRKSHGGCFLRSRDSLACNRDGVIRGGDGLTRRLDGLVSSHGLTDIGVGALDVHGELPDLCLVVLALLDDRDRRALRKAQARGLVHKLAVRVVQPDERVVALVVVAVHPLQCRPRAGVLREQTASAVGILVAELAGVGGLGQEKLGDGQRIRRAALLQSRADDLEESSLLANRVLRKAAVAGDVADIAVFVGIGGEWNEGVGDDVIHVPLEIVALELLTQLDALRNIRDVPLEVAGEIEVDRRIVVHPHSSNAVQVVRDGLLGVLLECVRALRAEDVPDTRARDDLQLAAAHPDSERHLEVLAAPRVHTHVVRADLEEVLAVDREDAARHRRRHQRVRDGLALRRLGRGDVQPVEFEVPREDTALHDGGAEFPRVLLDGVDDGHGHSRAVLHDTIQQRLEPAVDTLAVAVHVHEHISDRLLSTIHLGADEAHALLQADNTSLLELRDVLVEGALEVLVGAAVVHEQNLLEQVGRGAVEDTAGCAQQSRARLVVENDDDAHGGHLLQRRVLLVEACDLTCIVKVAAERKAVTDELVELVLAEALLLLLLLTGREALFEDVVAELLVVEHLHVLLVRGE
eukprot:m.179574 g.179574  ORF g.179574 m.179574 type:complete len:579 (+) comp9984_c0_seq2:44-1780(+)